MVFDTVANIVSEAAEECGLGAVSDVFASTDGNVVQLRRMLKRVGRGLVRAYDWSHLLKEASFTTVAATATYALPAAFGRMVNQSGWNRTSVRPLAGPLSPQAWQYLKARPGQTSLTLWFRPWQRLIQFPDGTATPGGQEVAYEYMSRYWVQPTGETAPTTDAPSANSDTLWLDSELLVAALGYRWLARKGLPAEAALEDFQEAWAAAVGDDSPAPILSLGGGGGGGEPRLGWANIPDTGYGDGT